MSLRLWFINRGDKVAIDALLELIDSQANFKVWSFSYINQLHLLLIFIVFL